MPEHGALYVFAFFSLREFVVAPVLALFHLNRTPIRRSRQYTQGVVHSAIAGGLATLIVTVRQHHQIDDERTKKGESPSAPPDYRAFAMSIGQLCAIIQFMANIIHLWRAPTPLVVSEPKEEEKPSDSVKLGEDEADRIDGVAIVKLTGCACKLPLPYHLKVSLTLYPHRCRRHCFRCFRRQPAVGSFHRPTQHLARPGLLLAA